MNYCCSNFEFHISQTCPEHVDRFDCPDIILVKFNNGDIGIPIRDGGSSMYTIKFCPWCGVKL